MNSEYMIIRNCHKKYNLCRNDAAASPFGKGCHEVAGYVSNNHTLLNPKCFFYRELFNRNIPPSPFPKGEADASHIFHLRVVIADNH